MTFLLVQDPAFPTMPPWWMVLLPRGDHAMLLRLHKTYARQFWILDGRDPHAQTARSRAEEKGELSLAHLRHPTVLSGHWLTTALGLFTRTDLLVSKSGGMRPRDGTLTELARQETGDWPKAISPDTRITITTWGTHFYLVSRQIAFEGKHDTEEAAMAVARCHALPEHIEVKREAHSFRAGD